MESPRSQTSPPLRRRESISGPRPMSEVVKSDNAASRHHSIPPHVRSAHMILTSTPVDLSTDMRLLPAKRCNRFNRANRESLQPA